MDEREQTSEQQRAAAQPLSIQQASIALHADAVFSHSATIAKLAEALAVAQAQFPELKASQTADADKYKYNYADLASVLAAVRPSLSAQGIAILQGVSMQRPQGGGATVAVESRLLHKSGEWIATTLKLPTAETAPQKVGSLVSYLRRYGLLAITAVAAEDDDGASAGNSEAPPPRAQAPRQSAPRATAAPKPMEAPKDAPAATAKPAAAAAAPKAAAAAAERHKPLGTEGTINAADRGLLFKIAKEQRLSERHVKGLIFSLFGYASTSQIKAGPEFNKVVNAMEDPKSHGIVFEGDDVVYVRENDLTPMLADITEGLP